METGCAEVSGRLADSIQINYQCLGKRSHIKLVGIQLCFPPPPPHAWPPAKGAEQNQCCLPFLAQTYSHSDTIKKRCIGRRAFKIQRCFPSIHHTIMGRTKPVAKTRGARCPLWSGTAATNPCTQDNPIATLLPSFVGGRGALQGSSMSPRGYVAACAGGF